MHYHHNQIHRDPEVPRQHRYPTATMIRDRFAALIEERECPTFQATLALINTLYAEGAPRNRALAIWSMASAGGLALGTLLGGVLTQQFGGFMT